MLDCNQGGDYLIYAASRVAAAAAADEHTEAYGWEEMACRGIGILGQTTVSCFP